MKIGVIDYGASNIFSVVRALNSLGASTKILKKSKDFQNIDKLVFPGQGSMGACLKKLSENDLRDSLIFSLKNLPFLGICLGLQILFSESEESEDEKGLGIFPEKIKKFRQDDIDHKDIAYEEGATKKGLYSVMDKVIKTGSRIAINISEKI